MTGDNLMWISAVYFKSLGWPLHLDENLADGPVNVCPPVSIDHSVLRPPCGSGTETAMPPFIFE